MNSLADLLAQRILEQLDKLDLLLARVPGDAAEWRPAPEMFTMAELVSHLVDAAAGFGAVLSALYPKDMADIREVVSCPVRTALDARERLAQLQIRLQTGFQRLGTGDLELRVPSVFIPAGQPVLTALLNNFEHLLNHKHQLFVYLKLLGVAVGSRDLYVWHDPAAGPIGTLCVP